MAGSEAPVELAGSGRPNPPISAEAGVLDGRRDAAITAAAAAIEERLRTLYRLDDADRCPQCQQGALVRLKGDPPEGHDRITTCRNCGEQLERMKAAVGVYHLHILTGKTLCDMPPRFPGDELTWLARPQAKQP